MIFLEIAMIVVGLGAIILSLKITEKNTETEPQQMQVTDPVTSPWEEFPELEQEVENFRTQTERITEELQDTVRDQMNELSNEKIMGISEYSDQVLDKIAKNHEEVVFLYNMLQEKQEEIKGLVSDTDKLKAEMHDEMAQVFQEQKEIAQQLEESIQEQKEMVTRMEGSNMSQAAEMDILVEEDTLVEDTESTTSVEEISQQYEDVTDASYTQKEEILALYEKGHSLLEISKLLGLGQGEVKFVIDVYGR